MTRALGAVAVLLCACGPKLETGGDACLYLGQAGCDRLAQCNALTVTTDTCAANTTRQCCLDIDCSRAISDVPKLQRCERAFRTQGCGDAIGNVLPAECR